jgi:hypothetical protein
MHEREKSDPAIGAGKPTNKAEATSASVIDLVHRSHSASTSTLPVGGASIALASSGRLRMSLRAAFSR